MTFWDGSGESSSIPLQIVGKNLNIGDGPITIPLDTFWDGSSRPYAFVERGNFCATSNLFPKRIYNHFKLKKKILN